jgi:hypothetical protein
MKKITLPLAAMALVVLLSLGVSGSMPTGAQALTAKPNIVFILTDDMRKDDLRYMPKTRSVLKAKGKPKRLRLPCGVLPGQGHHHARAVRPQY